ncbi:MAG: zinc-dependent alcohol dehydrogenase [Candidatus Humimicrobiaceae bacterium]
MKVYMKAARAIAPGRIEVVDVDKPKVGPNDVLSKVKYVGICGTDLSILQGDSFLVKEGLTKYPITLGHEWSGYVEEVGENVKYLKPGDRVVGDASISCGECIDCMAGNYNLCKNVYGVGTINNWDGAYAEYIIYPSRHMFKIPESVSMEDAALVEPAATAGFAVQKLSIEAGDIVLVHGTGAIGLFAVQYAKIMGASIVILSGRKDNKLKIGEIVGADFLVNINKDDLESEVMKITKGRGADAVIEASGSVSALVSSFNIIRGGGKISIVGFFEQKLIDFDINKIVINDITVRGSQGSPGFFPKTIGLMEAGRIKCQPLITHRFPFSKIREALEAMTNESETRIKIIVES